MNQIIVFINTICKNDIAIGFILLFAILATICLIKFFPIMPLAEIKEEQS